MGGFSTLTFSELLLPGFPLHIFSIFSFTISLISSLFKAAIFGVTVEEAGGGASSETLLPPDLLTSAVMREEMKGRRGWFEGGESEACAVCLCELQKGCEIYMLESCSHVFHRFCLDGWVEHQHLTCPLCRTFLLPLHSLPSSLLPLLQLHTPFPSSTSVI